MSSSTSTSTSTSTALPQDILHPLTTFYQIYLEAVSWFPRPPVKLITHRTIQHLKLQSAGRHSVSVYTLYGPEDGLDNYDDEEEEEEEEDEKPKTRYPPISILPTALTLTSATTSILDLDRPQTSAPPSFVVNDHHFSHSSSSSSSSSEDDECTHPPVPALAPLTLLSTAHTHSNMCDFSLFAFLGPLRSVLEPLGVAVEWACVIPSLSRTTTDKEQPPFYLRRWTSDMNDDGEERMPFHSVFLLTVPSSLDKMGREEKYIVDFSYQQYGIVLSSLSREPLILPYNTYLTSYTLPAIAPLIIARDREPEMDWERRSTYVAFVRLWRSVAAAVASEWGMAVRSEGREVVDERCRVGARRHAAWFWGWVKGLEGEER